MPAEHPPDPPVTVHVTAAEAYPAFERLCLSAEREIVGGFRIFDLSTPLRSPEGQAIGSDWFDLLLHVLRRGVEVLVTVSDFDPVVGTELHGQTWLTVRQAAALAELAGPEARLSIRHAMHPARVGWLARLFLWPRVDRMLREKAARILKLERPRRARFLRNHPHLSRLLMTGRGDPGPRRWPLPPLAPVTHHQKVAVVDGTVLYIGGLDLNERRWDDRGHARPAEETWHDIQVIVRDAETARAAVRHLGQFVDVTELDAEAGPQAGRFLRTLSAKRRRGPLALSPKPVLDEIAQAVIEGIRGATQLIYLETQFLRDRRIAAELARAAGRNPDLGLIVILPARPEDVAFLKARSLDARFGEFLQAVCIRKLRRAFRGRVFLGSPVQPRLSEGAGPDTLLGSPIIYVHSKVCVFDDARAVVSSANLNGRSLHWDTEAGVMLDDPEQVRLIRHRCMAGVLGPKVDVSAFASLQGSVPVWQRHALVNARAEPSRREGFVVPHLSAPARRFGRRLPAVPEDLV